MTNKINQLFKDQQDKKLLSLYFCAGCPTLENTGEVIKTMQRRGIAMIEVGIPFSDPLADGPVIQSAATRAIKNGMSLKKLFSQLQEIKEEVEIPLVLMGYLNPIMHYGIEAFWCQWSHHPRPALQGLPGRCQTHCRQIRPAYHHADNPRNIRGAHPLYR